MWGRELHPAGQAKPAYMTILTLPALFGLVGRLLLLFYTSSQTGIRRHLIGWVNKV